MKRLLLNIFILLFFSSFSFSTYGKITVRTFSRDYNSQSKDAKWYLDSLADPNNKYFDVAYNSYLSSRYYNDFLTPDRLLAFINSVDFLKLRFSRYLQYYFDKGTNYFHYKVHDALKKYINKLKTLVNKIETFQPTLTDISAEFTKLNTLLSKTSQAISTSAFQNLYAVMSLPDFSKVFTFSLKDTSGMSRVEILAYSKGLEKKLNDELNLYYKYLNDYKSHVYGIIDNFNRNLYKSYPHTMGVKYQKFTASIGFDVSYYNKNFIGVNLFSMGEELTIFKHTTIGLTDKYGNKEKSVNTLALNLMFGAGNQIEINNKWAFFIMPQIGATYIENAGVFSKHPKWTYTIGVGAGLKYYFNDSWYSTLQARYLYTKKPF